jgi:hypothetical protein
VQVRDWLALSGKVVGFIAVLATTVYDLRCNPRQFDKERAARVAPPFSRQCKRNTIAPINRRRTPFSLSRLARLYQS